MILVGETWRQTLNRVCGGNQPQEIMDIQPQKALQAEAYQSPLKLRLPTGLVSLTQEHSAQLRAQWVAGGRYTVWWTPGRSSRWCTESISTSELSLGRPLESPEGTLGAS